MIAKKSPAILESSVKRPTDTTLFTTPFSRINFVDNTFIKSSAVISQADPLIGLTDQLGNVMIQTNGLFSTISVPNVGTRLSSVIDPSDSSKRAWLFKCASTDADTAGTGAKRTEFSFPEDPYQGIKEGKEFLFCMATRLGESWSGLTDSQLICQIHATSGSPVFAIYVTGTQLRVSIRRGAVGSAEVPLYTTTSPSLVWDKWVVSGRTGQDGFLQVWRNGSLVVDYVGVFGYTIQPSNYLKAGIYHWTDSGNAWDTTLPERTLYYKGPWMINKKESSVQEALEFIETV